MYPRAPTQLGPPNCLEFQPVPRIVKNILSSLQIKCSFEREGCAAVVRLENLSDHVESCAYNKVMCRKGCGLYIVKHGMKEHKCVAVLKTMVQDQNYKIALAQNKIEAQNDRIAAQYDMIKALNDLNDVQNEMIKAQNEKIVNIEKWIEEEKESRRLTEERS